MFVYGVHLRIRGISNTSLLERFLRFCSCFLEFSFGVYPLLINCDYEVLHISGCNACVSCFTISLRDQLELQLRVRNLVLETGLYNSQILLSVQTLGMFMREGRHQSTCLPNKKPE